MRLLYRWRSCLKPPRLCSADKNQPFIFKQCNFHCHQPARQTARQGIVLFESKVFSTWNQKAIRTFQPRCELGIFSRFSGKMPPVSDEIEQVKKIISDPTNIVVVFSKTTCPYCTKVKALFEELRVKINVIELDTLPNGTALQNALHTLTNQRTVPSVFIRGKHIGGCDSTLQVHQQGKLLPLINGDETSEVKQLIDNPPAPVLIFSKTTCPYCKKAKELFASLGASTHVIEVDTVPNGSAIQDALAQITNQKTVPNIFIRGQHIGGFDATNKIHAEGKLVPLIQGESNGTSKMRGGIAMDGTSSHVTDVNGIPGPEAGISPAESATKKYKRDHSFDYDLVVIGGGSGGLAASKEAARLGAKVAVFDFVTPTPQGTTWGLGGTCVNVGCIPKKLMHQAAILGESYEDAIKFGWELQEGKPKHNWEKMITNIQDYIHSLNFKYKVALRDAKVTYFNSYAKFVDQHTILAVDKKGKETKLTSDRFIIATGGRPRYPNIQGAKEYAITSDDIFALPYAPGKTLCIGASYVALECAGFLAGLGYDVTVMVRSILLRGFDQDMAERIGVYMEKERGVKFHRKYLPTKIEQIEAGTPGRYRVTSEGEGEPIVEEYNTIFFAIGRDACTNSIGIEHTGVTVNPKTGKIPAQNEQTNVENIFAIGDVLDGKPELTPVAIKAGILLAQRLFAGSNLNYDYEMVPTTVFTPLEYGAIGLAEEDAIAKYGASNIEVYHTAYRPLEWTVPGHGENFCYGKLVCNKMENDRVVGFHVLGPNAGEITQGYAVGMRLGATKKDFDLTTGIHPTSSEIFTTLTITKSSGTDPGQAGC